MVDSKALALGSWQTEHPLKRRSPMSEPTDIDNDEEEFAESTLIEAIED